MENKVGAELPQPEVVQLNQRFLLFKPERTVKNLYGRPASYVDSYDSHILLDVEQAAKVPINFITWPAQRTEKRSILAPFNFKEGTTVTIEDLILEKRIKKFNRRSLRRYIDLSKIPFVLGAETNGTTLYKAGIAEREEDRFVPPQKIKPEYLSTFRNLFLQLHFPHISVESRADREALQFSNALLGFYDFYPLDTGPLPFIKEERFYTGVREGYSIGLPDNLDKLAQIEGEFILREEVPNSIER